MFSVVFSWVVKWLRRKKIEYNKLGLFESVKFRHLEIQSWTACRIIKLVAYYEIPLVFAITTKERENIAYFRFLESARRHFTRTNKMNNKIVHRLLNYIIIISNGDINIWRTNNFFHLDEWKLRISRKMMPIKLSIYKIYFAFYHTTNNQLNSPFLNVNRLKIVHKHIWRTLRGKL